METITIKPRSFCFVVFNATTTPPAQHTDSKLQGLEGASRVALRRAIVRKLNDLFCVQIMKSASLFIAPLSSMGSLEYLCEWITSSDLNEAHCFEGDFVPPDDQLFEAVIEEAGLIFDKIGRQKQNTKGKAQLAHQLSLLDHFSSLLTTEQRTAFQELQASFNELGALELEK